MPAVVEPADDQRAFGAHRPADEGEDTQRRAKNGHADGERDHGCHCFPPLSFQSGVAASKILNFMDKPPGTVVTKAKALSE